MGEELHATLAVDEISVGIAFVKATLHNPLLFFFFFFFVGVVISSLISTSGFRVSLSRVNFLLGFASSWVKIEYFQFPPSVSYRSSFFFQFGPVFILLSIIEYASLSLSVLALLLFFLCFAFAFLSKARVAKFDHFLGTRKGLAIRDHSNFSSSLVRLKLSS